MHFGFLFNPTDQTIDLLEMAREVEGRGFESLFVPEHTHIPIGYGSKYPYGNALGPQYRRTYAPIAAMTAIAGATERIQIGTAVLLVPEHDPILLAKEISTLDHLSKGRLQFGIGAGWNREEMINHGIDPKDRFKIMRERILAMKTIWAHEEAEYHGEFVNFDPLWQWPKPIQRPHPPILIGGVGPGVLKRVIEYGDGWIPGVSAGEAPVLTRIPELNRMAEEAGRGPLPVSIVTGNPELAAVERFAAAGAVRTLYMTPAGNRDEMLALVDRFESLKKDFG